MSIRCEDFVVALTVGGPFRRWRATRHAARCRRCGVVRDELQQVVKALTDVPPLTAAQRNLWGAGEEDASEALRPWRFRPVLAGALATTAFIAFGVWWAFRPADLRVGPTTVEIVAPAADRDVESLRNVVDFARELEELRRQAEMLDARKDLDALLARLAPRGDTRGL